MQTVKFPGKLLNILLLSWLSACVQEMLVLVLIQRKESH